MTNTPTNPKVDAFLDRQQQWQPEMRALREIALGCGLTEEVKWGKPCYADAGNNIVLIQGFKAYCTYLFFKGALLDDPDGLLVKVGEHSRAGRQARFTDVAEIDARRDELAACIRQAIAVERSGAQVDMEAADELEAPEELQRALEADPRLNEAFYALTPGRQREYLLYFSGAKQAKTREARVEKCTPQILDGLGLRDT